jgi:cell division protease FtsH
MTARELLGKIDVLLGGRAAEEIVFGELSTGAHDDLHRATEIARSMVIEYGMGGTLGPATFPRRRPQFLGGELGYLPDGGREYSEGTARALDEETKRILDERLAHVVSILREKRHHLDRISSLVREREVVEGEEFARIMHEEDALAPVPRPEAAAS